MREHIHLTKHFALRSATRGFSEYFIDVLLEHGDFTDQKGGCHALAISKAKAHQVRRYFADGLQQKIREKRLRDRQTKRLRLLNGKSAEEMFAINEEEVQQGRQIRALRKQLQRIKSGFVVLGQRSEIEGLSAITVAPITRNVKGFKKIYE